MTKEATPTKPTHIRFIGTAGDDTENSSCSVFGKVFFRGKWVPLTNLDGTNPDKTPLTEAQMVKLLGNPAFQLGDGKVDDPLPGMDEDVAQEA